MKVIYNKKSVILVTIILSSLLNYNQSFAIVEEEKQLSSTDEITTLTILHINDLHGWLNPRDGYGGMATLMGYFEGREGYTKEDDSYLLLSGGDQNTGPAVATLSKGIAVVDTMNEMGFDAAAIGNHEFDFGTDWMNTRQDMASYPILSSNIFEKGTSNLADFAIPYVIQNHSGVAVGIIGLTTTTSSTTSHPKITQDFDFGDYEEALRANIDDVKAAGAEVIIALTHVTPEVLIQIATYTEDLGINLFLGGHGGTPQITEVGSSVVAMAGHRMTEYVSLKMSYNTSSKSVVNITGELIANMEGNYAPNLDVQAVVDYWYSEIDVEEVITYSSEDIYDEYQESRIGNLVADGFLYALNWTVNFGVTNRGGGFRDYFRAGNITVGDVVSVMPFENNLLKFGLLGSELTSLVTETLGKLVFSGMKYNFSVSYDQSDFQIQENGVYSQLDPFKTYTGVIIDYTWYVNYQDRFPGAFDTGIHYRDAVVSYFRTIEDLTVNSVNRISYDDYYSQETTDSDPTDGQDKITSPLSFNLYSFGLLLMVVIVYNRKRKKVSL